MMHKVNVDPAWYDPYTTGCCRHVAVRDNGKYKTGDIVELDEYNAETKIFSGRSMTFRVTHITPDGSKGVAPGFIILGLQ